MERGDAAEGAGPVDHDHDHDHDHPTRPTPFEHEHDHDDRAHGGFPHERLDAYRVALTMATTSNAADLVVALELGPEPLAVELKHLAGRVAAMLTGLTNRLS